MYQNIINYLMSLHWQTIVALLGDGVGTSVALQILKRLGKLESKKVIKFTGASFAFAAAALQLVLADPGALSMLGIYAPAVWGFSQGAYIVVKWIQVRVDRINAALAMLNAQSATVAQPSVQQTVAAVAESTDQNTPQVASASDIADF